MKLQLAGIAAALVILPIACGAVDGSSTAASIEAALVDAPRGWTSIWTPIGSENWERPAGTGSARFVRREGRVYEIFMNHLMGGRVCVNEVFIDAAGLTRFGCTRVPKQMTFHPSDPLVPFTGQAENGYAYRLVPRE